MSNTQRIAVAAVAVILVALGLFLVGTDEPQPGPTAEPAAERLPPVPSPTPTLIPTDTPPAANPPPVAEAQPVAPAAPTVEKEPSPFDRADSPELAYAIELVNREGSGPTEWRKAAEVFTRCVDANRFNHLCRRGLAAAWERLESDGGPTHLLDAPVKLEPGALRPFEPR